MGSPSAAASPIFQWPPSSAVSGCGTTAGLDSLVIAEAEQMLIAAHIDPVASDRRSRRDPLAERLLRLDFGLFARGVNHGDHAITERDNVDVPAGRHGRC